MSKKITLTSITGELGEISVDEIESVDVVNNLTFIVTKDDFAFLCKRKQKPSVKND